MSNLLVKILFDDDGQEDPDPVWHLANPVSLGDWGRTLCTGEVFGGAEGAAVFETKYVKRGIPCSTCKEMIQGYKKVKL